MCYLMSKVKLLSALIIFLLVAATMKFAAFADSVTPTAVSENEQTNILLMNYNSELSSISPQKDGNGCLVIPDGEYIVYEIYVSKSAFYRIRSYSGIYGETLGRCIEGEVISSDGKSTAFKANGNNAAAYHPINLGRFYLTSGVNRIKIIGTTVKGEGGTALSSYLQIKCVDIDLPAGGVTKVNIIDYMSSNITTFFDEDHHVTDVGKFNGQNIATGNVLTNASCGERMLTYRLNVEKTGTYNMKLYSAFPVSKSTVTPKGGTVCVENNGQTLAGPVVFDSASSNSWFNCDEIELGDITLLEGQQTITLKASSLIPDQYMALYAFVLEYIPRPGVRNLTFADENGEKINDLRNIREINVSGQLEDIEDFDMPVHSVLALYDSTGTLLAFDDNICSNDVPIENKLSVDMFDLSSANYEVKLLILDNFNTIKPVIPIQSLTTVFEADGFYNVIYNADGLLNAKTVTKERFDVYDPKAKSYIEVLEAIYIPSSGSVRLKLAPDKLPNAFCYVRPHDGVLLTDGKQLINEKSVCVNKEIECGLYDVSVKSIALYREGQRVMSLSGQKSAAAEVTVVNNTNQDVYADVTVSVNGEPCAAESFVYLQANEEIAILVNLPMQTYSPYDEITAEINW